MTAVLVLLQVAYLKLFVTHDTALFGGLIAGVLAAFLYGKIKPIQGKVQTEGGL